MSRRKRRRLKLSEWLFGKPKSKSKHRGTPGFWAALTILAFPVVLLSTDLLGLSGLWPFALAILASLAILALEILVRGRMWMFEEEYAERLHHPRTPIRIILVAAGVVLILETALILAVAVDRRTNDALLGLVLRKECRVAETDAFAQSLCRFLHGQPVQDDGTVDVTPATFKDPVSLALRSHAARTWYEDEPLVTCANRKVDQLIENESSLRHAALVECIAWRISPQGKLQVKTSRTAFIGAHLEKERDGLYRVLSWSDGPAEENWEDVLGAIATRARRISLSVSVLEELRAILHAESLGRAQQQLQK